MLNKYTTLFEQSENINTDEAYKERDQLYKDMSFEEIMNLVNELEYLVSLMTTNLHEFKLDINEIGAITSWIKNMQPLTECLNTICLEKRIHGER